LHNYLIDRTGKRVREVTAGSKALRRIFRQRSCERGVQLSEFWANVTEPWRWGAEVLGDHHGWVGVDEWRCTGQQVECRGRQRVLIRSTVGTLGHELFGSRV
jgi:hypothetical protein